MSGEVLHAGAPRDAVLAGDVENGVAEDEGPDDVADLAWKGEEG